MAAQKITGFLGILPRTAERLLPDLGAQIAENVNLTSGEIRPMRPPMLAHVPADYSSVKESAYRADNGTIEKWKCWTMDVDVARAPLSPDVEPRYYWTGEVCPRYTTFRGFGYRTATYAGVYGSVTTCTCLEKHGLTSGDTVIINAVELTATVTSEYVFTVPGDYHAYTAYQHKQWDFALGMMNPQTKPAASASGGSGMTINRVYCYTFYQPATGEESGISDVSDSATGKVDGTWTITTFDAAPANSGTYSGSYSAATGLTTCTAAARHYLRTGDTVTISSVDYVVTVTSTTVFTVAGDVHTPTAWARKVAWNTSGLYQRLYRTSGTTADFQLVAERAGSTGNWTDTVTDTSMPGDSIVTADYEAPPADLKGIIPLPNGAMAGFRGNELLFSEPYQPHAWPSSYRYQVESEIVGIAAYGTTVVVATETRPFYADGVTPDVVTVQGASYTWPCLSKRSVCGVGDGVVYATQSGLAYIGSSGEQILTRAYYTTEEWAPINPASMSCRASDNRLFLLYAAEGTLSSQMMVFLLQENTLISYSSDDANALYVDPLTGSVYLITENVSLFDGLYGQRYDWVWKSKETEVPNLINFGAGVVEFVGVMSTADVQAGYSQRTADMADNQAVITAKTAVGAFGQSEFNVDPVNGAFGITDPTSLAEYCKYTLFDHDNPVITVDAVSGVPFRLPAGYRTDAITHQLQGNVRCKVLKVASSMAELRSV